MKRFVNIFFALMVLGWIGCEDMNDRHQQYLEEGEQVYIGKADSVLGYNGFQRIKLTFQVSKDPKLTGISIYWNQRTDSIYVAIDKTKGERMGMIVPIPEGKYSFELDGRSEDGGRSITSFASANSYGADYQSTLYNRVALTQNVEGDSLTITWGATINSVGAFLEYKNRHNNNVKLFIKDATKTTILKDFVHNGEFKMSTLYIPDDICFDTVSTVPGIYRFPKRIVAVPVDVSKWTKVHASNENKPAENMLDNNPGTWWECDYPKWGPFEFIFEMDKVQGFDRFWVETQKPTFIRDATISYAMTKEGPWVYYGVAAFEEGSFPETKTINNSIDEAKFIKLIINNREDPQATISGIGAYKMVEIDD